MSRKTSRQGSMSIDLEADKLARLQLVEARRKLNHAQGRSPSQSSLDGLGSRSPVPRKDLSSSSKPDKPRKSSITSSTATLASDFKWVNIDGKGNWQKIRILKVEDVQDDFKDEDLAGSKSGEESEQYWADLQADLEKREGNIKIMVTDFIDVPEVILASEEVSLEHKEQKTVCQILSEIEEDLTPVKVGEEPVKSILFLKSVLPLNIEFFRYTNNSYLKNSNFMT